MKFREPKVGEIWVSYDRCLVEDKYAKIIIKKITVVYNKKYDASPYKFVSFLDMCGESTSYLMNTLLEHWHPI